MYKQNIDTENNTIKVSIRGEMDLYCCSQYKRDIAKKICENNFEAIEIELSGVTYIDSSGIALLLHIRSLALQDKMSFKIVGLSSVVSKILSLTKLNRFFGLV